MQIEIVWAGAGGIVESRHLWCGLVAAPITPAQVPFFFFRFQSVLMFAQGPCRAAAGLLLAVWSPPAPSCALCSFPEGQRDETG